LHHIQGEGENDGNLHPFERPDVDTLDIFPASQGGETGKCNKTNEGVDIYACARWPVLVDDGINDKCETVEQIGERRERQTRQDKGTTGNTSGDNNRGNGRRRGW